MAIRWWLALGAVLGPLAVTPLGFAETLAQAKNNAFLHLGLGVAVWSVRDAWVQTFVVLAWLSFWASGMAGWSFIGLLGVLAWALCYEAAGQVDTAWLWRAITVGAAAQMAWMVVQLTGHDALFVPINLGGSIATDRVTPPVGFFGNPSDAGLFLGLSLPAIAVTLPWLLPVTALAILLQHSTGGLVCLAVTALWLGARWGGAGVAAAGGVLMAVASFHFTYLDPHNFDGVRTLAWRQGWHVATLHPWLGWGPNAVDHRLVMVDVQGARLNFLFNEYLQSAVEMGFAAPALAIGYGCALLRRIWRAAAWAHAGVPALVMVAVTASFSIPYRIGPVALLSALYLGRLQAAVKES